MVIDPNLRRLLAYHRPHVPALLLSTLLMGVAALIPGALVLLIQEVLDSVLINRDEAALRLLPFVVVLLYAVNGAVNLWRASLSRGVAFSVVADLRAAMFRHMLQLEPAWHQATPLGERLSRLTQDAGQVQYLVSAYATAVQRPLTLIGLLIVAVRVDLGLTVAALVLMPLVIWPIRAFGARARATAKEGLEGLAALSVSAQQSLAGVKIVQSTRAEAARAEDFERHNEAQRQVQLRATMAQLLPGPVIELIAAVAAGIVIAYGGREVFAGRLTPGELVAFLVAMGLMNLPLKGLSEVSSLTQRALAAAERCFELLDRRPALVDGDEDVPPGPLRLELNNVQLSYGDGEVLRGVSLTLVPGELVVIVGPSGSGKSSLASLLPRLLDPSGGQVLLNGVDLRRMRLHALRGQVALLTQEPILFDATVAENLRLARPEADDAALWAALAAADAEDFVRALPLGLHTPLQDAGMRLSGGQRQRLCLARALIQDAPVLVLDEASSALDPESEARLIRTLRSLTPGRIVLTVAHRASVIHQADRVVVLDEGLIVQDGPPTVLLSHEGPLRRRYATG